MKNLIVENVQVRMGNDVWLRSAEANINLGGSVAVQVGRSQSSERAFDQLALEGTLTTNRGTYRLNLGIVQPKFVVENGTVQFLGDPDFNALLNINALNTVHRMSRARNVTEQDLRIRVHIGGTLVRPQLSLSSADSLLNISQTDLFSYLLTGAPSFSVSSQGATASLLRSIGSYLGDQLRGFGLFDVVDIELGRQGFGAGQGFAGGLNSIFSGARFGVGRQLGDRTFVSANAGLCQFGSLLGGGSGSIVQPLRVARREGRLSTQRERRCIGRLRAADQRARCAAPASARRADLRQPHASGGSISSGRGGSEAARSSHRQSRLSTRRAPTGARAESAFAKRGVACDVVLTERPGHAAEVAE